MPVLGIGLTAVGRVPMVAVLGNHDYEAGKQDEIRQILAGAGVTVLDGDTFEVRGVGFAGAKGFMGGFGAHVLEPWGERSLKNLVRETVAEALKLEAGLARLRTPQRVAVLHYAPIQATVEGEPPEIHALLGCSRWRSRSTATRWRPSSTATRTAASPRGGAGPAPPSTMSPCRCCAALSPTGRRFAWWSWRCRPGRRREPGGPAERGASAP